MLRDAGEQPETVEASFNRDTDDGPTPCIPPSTLSVISEESLSLCGSRIMRSCAAQIVFVTGGGQLTLTSSADSYIFSKLRFEVLGHTKLILDLPPATFTGFERSVSAILVIVPCRAVPLTCVLAWGAQPLAGSTSIPRMLGHTVYHVVQLHRIVLPTGLRQLALVVCSSLCPGHTSLAPTLLRTRARGLSMTM